MISTRDITAVVTLILSFILQIISPAECLGCFQCTSINKGNTLCEDTFNNTGEFYNAQCWANRPGRTGLFPATQCIKMEASDADTGFSIIVRDCVVDNGGTNSETEIGRESHCGWMRVIKYNGKRMRGCILSCDEDGCNGSSRFTVNCVLYVVMFAMVLLTSHKGFL